MKRPVTGMITIIIIIIILNFYTLREMNKIEIIVLALLSVLYGNSYGQLPQIEIALKPGVLKSVENIDNWETNYNIESGSLSLSGNINFFNGILALGGFYEKSMVYSKTYDRNNYWINTDNEEADVLLYGITFRISTSRETGVRPYIFGTYSKVEMTGDLEDMAIADESNALGYGIGCMIKLGQRVYLTLPEATIYHFKDDMLFFNASRLLSGKIGVTVVIGRKRSLYKGT